jgi:hypothetical protein
MGINRDYGWCKKGGNAKNVQKYAKINAKYAKIFTFYE